MDTDQIEIIRQNIEVVLGRIHDSAKNAVDKAVKYYNHRLPHTSIDLLTPEHAHHRIGKLKKHWKWYWREKQLPRIDERLYTPYY